MFESIKKNWISILSIAIGLAGIFLSYYFYTLSVKVREPAFIITKDVSLFSSPKGLSSKYLKLVKSSDGTELLKNVYIQEIVIWNNGKESIKKENILKPITLNFDSEIEIIDAFILEMNRPDIVKGEISFIPGANIVTTNFSILENNDGLKVQVVYASTESSIADIQGVIEGVDSIKNIDNLTKKNIFAGAAKLLMWVVAMALSLLLFASLGKISKWVVDRIFGGHAQKINTIIGDIFAIIMMLLVLVSIVFLIYKKTIDFSKESVVDSLPIMEKQIYNNTLSR